MKRGIFIFLYTKIAGIAADDFLVIPLGFEPKTHSLEGCCSIQLSYGTPIALSHAALCTWRRAPVKQEGRLATAKVIQFCLLSK